MVDSHALSRSSKAAAEALLSRIENQKLRATQAFYEIGGALRQLLDEKLYAPLGYASFDAMLEARDVMAPSQARKLIEVHSKFSAKTALSLGAEKAYAIARYVARTKTDDEPEDFIARGFPIAGRRRPIEEVSVRAVLDATRTAVSRQKGQRGESERARRDAETELAYARRVLREHEIDAAPELVFRRGTWNVRFELPAARVRVLLKPTR